MEKEKIHKKSYIRSFIKKLCGGYAAQSTPMKILDVLMILAVIGFAFYVNRKIVIKGLYMDDLYMWSCYGEQSIWEFAFPIGTSTRFRPVYWLATYLQMAIIGNHISRFITFNIIVNIITALEIFYMSARLAGGKYIGRAAGFIAALCYLSSRFAYYQIGQALGLMETMALAMSLLVLYLLLRYIGTGSDIKAGRCTEALGNTVSESGAEKYDDINCSGVFSGIREKSGRRYYYAALFIYFLLVFVHERYISLFPLFYLAAAAVFLCRKIILHSEDPTLSAPGKKAEFEEESAYTEKQELRRTKSETKSAAVIKMLISPIIVLAAIIIIRSLAIGKALPAGTGGTEVTDTFSIGQSIRFCFDQILYILGVNAGPEYLCGLTWQDTPWQIKRCVKFGILFTGLFCIVFLFAFICEALKYRKQKQRIGRNTAINDRKSSVNGVRSYILTGLLGDAVTCIMFFAFIALCIGCSSVTIRLEMRWIYVSYAAALLLASYMLGRTFAIFGDTRLKIFKIAAVLLLVLYAAVSVGTNIFYRGYFKNIYFWADQERMNSLAEETVEKYGIDGVLGKNIYIIGNTYRMSDFYADTFYKTFDPDKKADGTKVIFADSITSIPAEEVREGKALVLDEVPEENAYTDITEDIK